MGGHLGLRLCWLCRELGGFGRRLRLKTGQPSALRPAESVTLRPKFGAGHGKVVLCVDTALVGLQPVPEVRCGSWKSGLVCKVQIEL
eukprot:scaffold104786_cov66-Phaeocystis_antarctica.AAC.3